MPWQNNQKLDTQRIAADAAGFALDFDPDRAVRYLQELLKTNSFFWYLQEFFDEEHRITPQDDEVARKTIRRKQMKLLKDRADALGVEPPPIHRWLSGEIDLHRGKSDWKQELGFEPTRENLYKLCGVLGFDRTKTESFFRRAAFFAPWNRKSWRELIYSFYITRSPENWYSDSVRLIGEIEEGIPHPVSDAAGMIRETYEVERKLDEALREKEIEQARVDLKRFILDHWATFCPENLRYTAYQEIYALFEASQPYVLGEVQSAFKDGQLPLSEKEAEDLLGSAPSANTVFTALLEGIGLTNQDDSSLDKLGPLPKPIRLNKRELCKDMVKIKKRVDGGENGEAPANEMVSDTRLRKLLILLNFYYFYAQCRQNKCGRENRSHPEAGYHCMLDSRADYSGYFEEFCEFTNHSLEDTGFCTLYEGNGLDCLFLLAAHVAKPLDALRAIVCQSQAEE